MNVIKKYVAELIGTFTLTLIGCGTAVFVGCGTSGGIVATALAFGLSIVVTAYVIGNVSGCHINPAVSLAMYLDKRMSLKDMAGYMAFQIIGAIIAAGVLAVIASAYFGVDYTMLASLGQNSTTAVGTAGALLVEIVLTFIFVLLVLGATAPNGAGKSAGLVIGGGLTLVHLFGISLTGTSVNPARSIGPAVFFGGTALSQLWVFIVAPLIWAAIAWAVWKFILDSGAAAEA